METRVRMRMEMEMKRKMEVKENVAIKTQGTVDKNKVGYTAAEVVCGWAGAVIKMANSSIWAGAVMQNRL